MWRITFDRHYKNKLYETTVFETEFFISALFWYYVFRVGYFMSFFPLKQLTLTRIKNGITHIDQGKFVSTDPGALRRLKWDQRFYRF